MCDVNHIERRGVCLGSFHPVQMEFDVSYPRLATCLPDPSRHDFFHNAHKALRLGHCRMLAELGSHDFGREDETRALIQKLRGLIDLCRMHLQGEAREIHTAIEARKPGASLHKAADQARWEQCFTELQSLIRAVEVATPSRRNIAGQSLYQHYALFAAADIAQMHEEETQLLSALHCSFSDTELIALEERICKATPESMMTSHLALMMPALNQPERTKLIEKLQASVPDCAASNFLRSQDVTQTPVSQA